MTVEQVEDFAGLHERVLTFMGAFSSVQHHIDSLVGMYLRRSMPVLGEELDRQFLRRIRDDQRLPLFKAFAGQVNYAVDITHFGKIYSRAKQVRDLVGHAAGVNGPVYSPGGQPPVVAVASYATNTHLVPRPLLPSTFTRLKADCEWLNQHITRAGYEGNAWTVVDGSGQPYEPPTPAAQPEGGKPLR